MKVFAIVLMLIMYSVMVMGGIQKPIELDPTYNHDKFDTQPKDIVRKFRACTLSFDSNDNNSVWGIPEWVAYEIKKYNSDCIPTNRRYGMFPDEELYKKGLMPNDASYAYSKEWRHVHNDYFSRGHLLPKFIAARLGKNAEYNSSIFLNIVPQRNLFNSGIWLDLESLTGAWAQQYSSIWVITGPIIVDQSPVYQIGEKDKGEFMVAIPECLFKIVIKESKSPGLLDTLAFIYPQIGAGYTNKPYKHKNFLTSIDEIEELTGLDFLTNLPDDVETLIEKEVAKDIWRVEQKHFIHACR